MQNQENKARVLKGSAYICDVTVQGPLTSILLWTWFCKTWFFTHPC